MARIHLVLEYAGGGELFNLISSEGKLKEGDAVCVFAQLLSAVSYLVGGVSVRISGGWGICQNSTIYNMATRIN